MRMVHQYNNVEFWDRVVLALCGRTRSPNCNGVQANVVGVTYACVCVLYATSILCHVGYGVVRVVPKEDISFTFLPKERRFFSKYCRESISGEGSQFHNRKTWPANVSVFLEKTLKLRYKGV